MTLTPESVSVEIVLGVPDGVVRPGQRLVGGFEINVAEHALARRVELSVVWYTEGQGDKDLAVIHHLVAAEYLHLDGSRTFPIDVRIPDHPWSYHGNLIKIHWAVRVQVFPESGEDIAVECPFLLLPEGRVR
jgi:hypothetical protein